MLRFGKMISEKDILERLRGGAVKLPPLDLRLVGAGGVTGDREIDAIMEVNWRGQTAMCIAEVKSNSKPRTIRDAIERARAVAERKKLSPMIIVPFLNEEQLAELDRQEVSGLDLCGNGIVVIPGKLAVYRTGAKNRFPASAPIKNIYRKNTSMIPRVFLARAVYPAVKEVQAEVERRRFPFQRWAATPVALSTVSKALKSLEDDLIISREMGTIRLVQPDKLLENLSRNYSPTKQGSLVRRKVSASEGELRRLLSDASRRLDLPIVATGGSSVSRYAVMERLALLAVYCPDAEALVRELPGSAIDRFPNLEVIETTEELPYFDAREEEGFRWASPVQVFLELMTGDKRDVETADQVKELILRSLNEP